MSYFIAIKSTYPVKSIEEVSNRKFPSYDYAKGWCDAWYGEYLYNREILTDTQVVTLFNSKHSGFLDCKLVKLNILNGVFSQDD